MSKETKTNHCQKQDESSQSFFNQKKKYTKNLSIIKPVHEIISCDLNQIILYLIENKEFNHVRINYVNETFTLLNITIDILDKKREIAILKCTSYNELLDNTDIIRTNQGKC